MTTSRLYYEAHITVNEPDEISFDLFTKLADTYSWRSSKFSEDNVDDYNGKWFLSYRHRDLEKTKEAIRGIRDKLVDAGFEVIRAKIEDTLLDTKYGDEI